jgi:hypothetical protein
MNRTAKIIIGIMLITNSVSLGWACKVRIQLGESQANAAELAFYQASLDFRLHTLERTRPLPLPQQ